MASDTLIILTARDEADRIEATLGGLARAFPRAHVWVADDGSVDATAAIARQAGANVVRSERTIGKGGAATLAAREALAWLRQAAEAGGEGFAAVGDATVVVLCDADLGGSAILLAALADAVRERRADLAVAVFAKRLGGGLGLAVGFARWAIRRRCGLDLHAPLSGQRALRAGALEDVLPFAARFGMEVGMTIDAARAGHRVLEVELQLEHRATRRTFSGFLHRGRQLLDCAHVYLTRR
ncbi:MAG: glycosyltransferase [Solirubrobacteraceae bacterium]